MRSWPLCMLAIAAACVPQVRLAPFTQADSAEYEAYAGTGQLELRGQAFLTTPSGNVKLAAGRLVTLDPATVYARAWFRKFGADSGAFGQMSDAPEPRFVAARRTTTADAEGRFRFTRLVAGTYLVRSLVTWQEPADSEQQGGVVAALAKVEAGEPARVIVHELVTPDSTAILAVAILADAELMGRRYRTIGRVTGTSCDTSSEEPGRRDLVLKAGEKGADAVAHVACRKRGINLSCVRRMECVGEGVGWL